jgi:hypothetical protein
MKKPDVELHLKRFKIRLIERIFHGKEKKCSLLRSLGRHLDKKPGFSEKLYLANFISANSGLFFLAHKLTSICDTLIVHRNAI